MGHERGDAKDLFEFDECDEPLDVEVDSTPGSASKATVRPVFDIDRFAQETVTRERMPTITDEVATEEARIASVLMDSRPPRPRTDSVPDIEVAVRYADVDTLGEEEQVAFLRARLAPMSRVPRLTRKLTELGPYIEDPKTAFILGFIDGLLPLETIVEVAGLPEIDTLRALDRAIENRVITFVTKPGPSTRPRG